MGSGLLAWLQALPSSVWLAQSDSIWAYPFVLFLHSIGMALSAGCSAIVVMRVLGVARPLSFKSLRVLVPYFWTGLALNTITGTLLFNAAAERTGTKPIYYVKLACICAAVLTLLPVRRFVGEEGDGHESATPTRVRMLAAISLLLWTAVIVTGRLIAYTE
jgi:hypothetical protein